jgi:transcriptional regulator with XRE-family HTH domain
MNNEFIDEFRNYLCQTIKEKRILLGYSGAKIAKLAGISQSSYWNFENSNGTLEVKALISIIHALDLYKDIFSPIKSKALQVLEDKVDIQPEITNNQINEKLDKILALLNS